MVAQHYAADKTIGYPGAAPPGQRDRNDLAKHQESPVYGRARPVGVPLKQIATISYKGEDGLIWRRDLKPTITINGGIKSGTANDVTQKAYDSIADIRESMPFGYTVEVDGALENSQKSLKYLLVPVPVMVIIIMTLLMFQLRSPSLMFLALITAPMGLIGVSWGMLLFGKSLGFVADLGILALGGNYHPSNPLFLLTRYRNIWLPAKTHGMPSSTRRSCASGPSCSRPQRPSWA